jgi:hypothetical protein
VIDIKGWVKLYRDITLKDIYSKPPLYLRVFERLILEANSKCARIPYGKGTKLIKRGERLTSMMQIAEWVGWYERGIFRIPNKKTISDILNWLIENELIEIYDKGNARETHYNVVNYGLYQGVDVHESNAQVTEATPQGKRKVDTNKNVKKDKKDKNNNINTLCGGNPPRGKKEIKYDEKNIYYRSAMYLRKRMIEFSPMRKVPKDNIKSMQGWADTMRIIFEVDKRKVDELKAILDFVYKDDDFWGTVIQSPTSLRKHWDKIQEKMLRPSGKKSKEIDWDNI